MTLDQPTVDALNAAVAQIVAQNGLDSETNAPKVKAYRAFLAQQVEGVDAARLLVLGLSHDSPNSSCFGLNSMPPEELWRNSVGFAKILKRLEEDYKLKVQIVSGYRNAVYGSCAAGPDEGATHLKFQGFDIRLADAETFADGKASLMKALREMRDAGEFKGGLVTGLRSVHVDTRGTNVEMGAQSE